MSDQYQPLFGSDPADAGLVEGIPSWMVPPLTRWLDTWLNPGGAVRVDFIERFEMRHRITPFSRGSNLGWQVRETAMAEPQFGLTLINYILWVGHEYSDMTVMARLLADILGQGGSFWEVTDADEDDRYRLTRRDLAGTREAIAALPAGDRAADMLRSAWVKIASREPDASGAYDLAVKAVEAAAHPVVSPKREKATLGSMLGDMRAHPQKWSFVLEDLDTVIAMATTLWTHHYRHGTEQRDDHTLDEADTAVHLALVLVRLFTGNAVSVR
ncbi:MAG: hypothetical protein QOH30_3675 [Baekduia sp.]|nr:hypothetical protein [Baekduia sp.]